MFSFFCGHMIWRCGVLFVTFFDGLILKDCHSCVNGVSVPAPCLARSCAFLLCFFWSVEWCLARVDCSVCRSFVVIAVRLCA